MDSAVRLKDVTRSYEMGKVKVEALRGVTMEIAAGRFSVIAGPSGSGKTTLLNIMGLIDSPTGGTVEVCGTDVLRLNDDALSDFRARKVSFVFQTFNLIPVLSAYENVEYPLLLAKMPVQERKQRTMEMLEAVGIADFSRHRPNELSGGQRQRVAIARALSKRPDIVLADEPTANLDSKTGSAIIDLMLRMQRDHHATFIFCSHDRQVFEYAEELFIMKDGLLIERKVTT
ncbi:MAG: ABC transporter ATP-binding protein [Candidatus Magnetominusculus sp. LBB02]|nr:ABC transporter ATP-binding protein [Candidatus Magnetominusculus sp. LBB02]